jgi:putative acetyltransferase
MIPISIMRNNFMITIKRTNSEDNDFRELIKELDFDLKIRDGEDHVFYAQLNKIDTIKYALVAYEDDVPVGSGAIRPYSKDAMEVKRMYVRPGRRGQGIASIILKELESWCLELGCKKCMLETGKRQPEAIQLYKKNNYKLVPNFGKYENVENSVCFEKALVD